MTSQSDHYMTRVNQRIVSTVFSLLSWELVLRFWLTIWDTLIMHLNYWHWETENWPSIRWRPCSLKKPNPKWMLNKTTIKTDTCMHYNDKIKFNLVFKITNLTFQILIENLRFIHVHNVLMLLNLKRFLPFLCKGQLHYLKKTPKSNFSKYFRTYGVHENT